MQIFDTHAHYFDERFTTEYEGGMRAALENSVTAGVSGILNAATNEKNARQAIQLAEQYSFCYAAVGLHPTDSESVSDSELPRIWDAFSALAVHPKVVAIGEIGLDYHWEPCNKTRQKEIFRTQLSLAESLHLPVIVHDREAHGDCFEIVRQYSGVRGVFHSFSGSAEMARQLVELGWYISFSGTVTYKNAANVRKAVLSVPTDRILVETDAPYLSPVPHRGKINVSSYLVHTLQAIADILSVELEDIAAITTKNAKEFFQIS